MLYVKGLSANVNTQNLSSFQEMSGQYEENGDQSLELYLSMGLQFPF